MGDSDTTPAPWSIGGDAGLTCIHTGTTNVAICVRHADAELICQLRNGASPLERQIVLEILERLRHWAAKGPFDDIEVQDFASEMVERWDSRKRDAAKATIEVSDG